MKRLLISLAAAAMALPVLAACQQGTGGEPPVKTSAQAPVAGDAAMGPADAKVTLVEYFAPTCPVCKGWHDQVLPTVKTNYIDTGKVRFVVKEMPSHNPAVDQTIFGIARCVGADLYFQVLDSAFVRQDRIEAASRGASGPEAELLKLAKEFGMDKTKMLSCASDAKLVERLDAIETERKQLGVQGTPTLFVNGRMAPNDLAGLSLALDQALAASAAPAAPAPEAAPSPAASPAASPTGN